MTLRMLVRYSLWPQCAPKHLVITDVLSFPEIAVVRNAFLINAPFRKGRLHLK